MQGLAGGAMPPGPPATSGSEGRACRRLLYKQPLMPSGGEQDDEAPFAHVLSLGSRCLVAWLLRECELRRYAGPFDWIYSNTAVVRHCLKDNFTAFLDVSQLHSAGKAWGHETYGPMIGRRVVFPHHEPRGRDRPHFEHCAERFRRVMVAPERKLFVLGSLVKSRKELRLVRTEPAACSAAGVEQLFNDLRELGVSNFELAAVWVVEGPRGESRASSSSGSRPKAQTVRDTGLGAERLVLHELQCLGGCTGFRFKEPADEQALRDIIMRSAEDEPRRFALLPDPLPPDSSVLPRRRLGDPRPDAAAGRGTSSSSGLQPPRSKRPRRAPAPAEPGQGTPAAPADLPVAETALAGPAEPGADTVPASPGVAADQARLEAEDAADRHRDATGSCSLQTAGAPGVAGSLVGPEPEDLASADGSGTPPQPASPEPISQQEAADDLRVLESITALRTDENGVEADVDVEELLERLVAESEEELQREVAAARASAAAAASDDPELARALEASARAFEREARLRREAALSERALAATRPLPAAPGPRPGPRVDEALIASLVELGFPVWQAEEASRRCSSVEASVGWILQQNWQESEN